MLKVRKWRREDSRDGKEKQGKKISRKEEKEKKKNRTVSGDTLHHLSTLCSWAYDTIDLPYSWINRFSDLLYSIISTLKKKGYTVFLHE